MDRDHHGGITMTDKHPQYWKIRFFATARDLAIQRAHQEWREVCVSVGLDPAKDYVLNDADETITEKGPPDGP